MQVNMGEAKAQLSKLGELAWQGEEIVIAKAGKPYLRLTPFHQDRMNRASLGHGRARYGCPRTLTTMRTLPNRSTIQKIFPG